MKLFLICLALCLSGCATQRKARLSNDPAIQPSQVEARKLLSLCEDYFEKYLQLFPLEATSIGDHRYDNRLPDDMSEQHRRQQMRLYTDYLSQLAKINRANLTSSDRITRDVFKRDLELKSRELEFDEQLLPVGKMFDEPTRFALLGSGASIQPFKSAQDYENFLGRIKGFEIWVDTAIANMRLGLARGVILPRAIAEKSARQIESHVVEDVKTSLFYQPVLKMPAEIKESEKRRLTQSYTDAIKNRIVPAFRRLSTFLKSEYLPKCRETVGLSVLPHGREWYAFLVKRYTTTDQSPDEIFNVGNREVERIQMEMEKLRNQVGFQGDLKAFAKYLHGRARVYANRAELVKAYGELRGKIAPQITRLFGHVPSASFEIRPVEKFREATSASQYTAAAPDGSRPGVFYVNAARIEDDPLAISEALFLHEAIPGHHFQISIAREKSGLPRLRRFAGYNAFIEGWGLYAESLGPDLGCYGDPGQRLEALAMEMWRARRLVVDVGLHWKGWSRDQALQFLKETPTISDTQAVLEIDRYIAWPGQALAYKTGQLKILEIRARSEKALGEKFDVREFHDELLKDGALPLDVLDTKMGEWVERKKRN